MKEYDRVSTLIAFGVAPLDPEPWVAIEADPITTQEIPFHRVVNDDRSSSASGGRVFFPRYGYNQDESQYPMTEPR